MNPKTRTKVLDVRIRKLRNIVFHADDNVAERAHTLLKTLLAERSMLREQEPEEFDRFGNSASDRALLSKHGLTPLDFM